MDKVWPDHTLLRMTGPEGQGVSILQKAWQPGRTAAAWARFLVDDIISEGSANEAMILNRAACLKCASGTRGRGGYRWDGRLGGPC